MPLRKGIEMPTVVDLARLNRHVLLSKLASFAVLLFGLIGAIFYFRPSLVGVDSGAMGDYQGNPAWLLIGMILTLAGLSFLYISTRWPRQLKRTVRKSLPRAMTVELEVEEDSNSTTYYAVLSEGAEERKRTPRWRVEIWVHPPKAREDIGQHLEGRVFFHPELGRPVAIEYSKGVLWVIAGSGAVKKLLV
jgi:hypothetical protein